MFPFPAFLSKVSKMTYLAAFITLMIRVGQFMSLPFLAIYLTHTGVFTATQIGLVLGISGLVLSTTGFINGLFIDRGRSQTFLTVGLFLSGFCYFGFVYSIKLFYVLLLLNAVMGWFRSLIEISVMSVIVSSTEYENLGYAQSARFIAANLGVAIGPLFGAIMAKHQSLLIFYIAGTIHIALAFINFFFTRNHQINARKTTSTTATPFLTNLRKMFKDKILINITFINFLLWIVYAQLDTTVPQYLAGHWKNAGFLFSIMMFLNAIICVLFQPAILRLAETTSIKFWGMMGSLLFAVAFILIGLYAVPSTMIISAILMSFAELATLPINTLVIARLAPKHLIASYNGLASLGFLGISIGPFIGGYQISAFGNAHFFLINAILPMIAAYLYFKFIPREV